MLSSAASCPCVLIVGLFAFPLPSFLFVQRQRWSGWAVVLTCQCSGNPSASAGTVLLINLLPTGFHGDGNTHPTAARCHPCHLAPGVSVWVIAFHTVQKRVAIIASCRENEEMVTSPRGLNQTPMRTTENRKGKPPVCNTWG